MAEAVRHAAKQIGEDRPLADQVVRLLHERLPSLRFGTVALTIHDGRLTQIDITERRRFGH